MLGDASDYELLCAWRAGDKDAGGRLYRRHVRSVSRFFGNKLTSGDDAADLLQETFLALARSNEHAGVDSVPIIFRGYLYATARHVLCAHLRKKYKRQCEQFDFSVVCIKNLEPASISSIITQRRELQIFVEALRAIPLDDQIVLEFKYFDNLSANEIAEQLGISETTVPGRLQRAKVRLRCMVGQIASQTHRLLISEPSDDELGRWAREIREQMGWQDWTE